MRLSAQSIWTVFLHLSVFVLQAHAIDLEITSESSLKSAASEATYGAFKWYYGNETGQIPGAFPDKWWEGSQLFAAALNYWHLTGDTTYNEETSLGLQWQGGDKGDYMPSNYSSYLGNDDQMFWGLAAMSAAEMKFPDRSSGYSWLSLAQGVFNTQKARWDTTSCGGGLRWQIFVYQAGYTMKNAVSNGGFFQLAARLARYTDNDEYLTWAEKIWDWSASSPLLNNQTWNVADSTQCADDCADAGNVQWTYNYGTYLMGAAYMYNYTSDSKWLDRTNGLLQKMSTTFFPHGNIIEDITCEPREICNNNEILFKGLTSQWLAYVAILVPSTADTIWPKLQSSGTAAAASCTGHNNNTCGVRWYQSKYDGWNGMEEQISASQVFSANLLKYASDVGPVTSKTGGNSKSNPNAGEETSDNKPTYSPITGGDKAGALILTIGFVGGWVVIGAFMLLGA